MDIGRLTHAIDEETRHHRSPMSPLSINPIPMLFPIYLLKVARDEAECAALSTSQYVGGTGIGDPHSAEEVMQCRGVV